MATRRNVPVLALAAAITTNFEPLIQALNNDIRRGDAKADTGQDKAPDGGLKFMLARNIQLWHDQVYGEIPSSTGQKFYNVKEQFDYAQEQVNKLIQKFDGDADGFGSDPVCHYAVARLEIAEARYNAYVEMIHALSTVYKEVTREDWKPYVRGTTQQQRLAKAEGAVVSAKMASLMAKMGKKEEPAGNVTLLRRDEAGELKQVAAQ